jgi:hypothetical protein
MFLDGVVDITDSKVFGQIGKCLGQAVGTCSKHLEPKVITAYRVYCIAGIRLLISCMRDI